MAMHENKSDGAENHRHGDSLKKSPVTAECHHRRTERRTSDRAKTAETDRRANPRGTEARRVQMRGERVERDHLGVDETANCSKHRQHGKEWCCAADRHPCEKESG